MPTDLTVVLRDEPGQLAHVGDVLVGAGVHVRGLAAFTGEGRGFVHALIDDGDADAAQRALKRARIGVADVQDVLVADVGAGGLVDVLLRLADANVNVDLAYTACHDQVVIATDDVFNARDVLDG